MKVLRKYYTVLSKDSKNKFEFKLELSNGIIPYN